MYAKVKIFTLCIICMLFISSCCTDKGTRQSIIEHQREIDRVEEELRSRDRAINNAIRELEDVTTRSTSMEGTIDELIKLFRQYQRTVEQVIRELNEIQTTSESSSESISSYYYIINNYDCWKDCWICTIRKRYKVTTLA